MPYLQPPLTHSELQAALDVGARRQGWTATFEFLRWRTITMVALIGGLATHQPLVVLTVTVVTAVLAENWAIPRMLAWENAAIIKVLSGGGSSRLQLKGAGTRQVVVPAIAGFALWFVVLVIGPKSDVIATLFYVVTAAVMGSTAWIAPPRGIADARAYSSWSWGSVDVPTEDDPVDVERLASGTMPFIGFHFSLAGPVAQVVSPVFAFMFLGAVYLLLDVPLTGGDDEARYVALALGPLAAASVTTPFAARTAAKKVVRVAQDALIVRSQNKRVGGIGMGRELGGGSPPR